MQLTLYNVVGSLINFVAIIPVIQYNTYNIYVHILLETLYKKNHICIIHRHVLNNFFDKPKDV